MAIVDHNDRPRREREPLPSKEQIELISDIAALEAMQTDIDARIKHIEVDLDFEVGDDEWDQRARGALAAHRICMGHVTRRLDRLRRAVKPDKGTPDHISAKAAKQLASAEKQRAIAEANRAAKENKQAALLRERLAFIEKVNVQSFFMRAAAKMLDADTFDALMAEATKRYLNALNSHVPPLPSSESPDQNKGESTARPPEET